MSAFIYLEYIGEIELPIECLEDCYHQGDCYDNCKHWQRELNLNLDKAKMIKELERTGAWDRDELEAMDNDELEIKIIWIAAGNYADGCY